MDALPIQCPIQALREGIEQEDEYGPSQRSEALDQAANFDR